MNLFRRLLRGVELDDMAWLAGFFVLALTARAMDATWEAEARTRVLERRLAEFEISHGRCYAALAREVEDLRERVATLELERLERYADRLPTIDEWGEGSLTCER